MKLKAISKDIVCFLGYIFFLFSSLNSSLGYGHYFSDEVLKSVEKHTSDSPILTNQAVTNGTATDQDGNTFAWKTFGDLDWALENANVTHYNDGTTEIPLVSDYNAWFSLESGGYCFAYVTENGEVTGSYYSSGKLYNRFAVLGIYDSASSNDPSLRKQFAPAGWRVATKADWENLFSFLNANGYTYNNNPTPSTPYQNIAQSMASGNTSPSWRSYGGTGTPGYHLASNNSSDLNIKPYGFRVNHSDNPDGYPSQNGTIAKFWAPTSTSEQLDATDMATSIYYNSLDASVGSLQVWTTSNKYGFSVRFVRDTNPTDDTTPPVITGNASLTIQENQTAVSIYSASEDVTWTLSGVDSALFDIDNPTHNGLVSHNSGELTFSSPPDFENPLNAGDNNNEYNVSLIATDSAGNVSNAFPVTVTVTDVDEDSPVITGSNTVSVQENQTAVSTYSASEEGVLGHYQELITASSAFQTQGS